MFTSKLIEAANHETRSAFLGFVIFARMNHEFMSSPDYKCIFRNSYSPEGSGLGASKFSLEFEVLQGNSPVSVSSGLSIEGLLTPSGSNCRKLPSVISILPCSSLPAAQMIMRSSPLCLVESDWR